MGRSKFRYKELTCKKDVEYIENDVLGIAIYVRISVKNKGSDSVNNQLLIAKRYIEELTRGEMNNRLRIFKYIDEGASGYSIGNRGELCRLLKDIDSGKIDCLIMKDISRLGRNYILISRLLDDMQANGIRVISITENYDSFKCNEKNYMNICIKNMLNDMYIKDTGRKISSSKEQLMRQGIYVGVYAPYGYICRNGKLYIDENVSRIVIQIYNWYIECNSIIGVIDKIEQGCINTKRGYIESKCIYKKGVRWNYKSVKDILTDEVYIGNLVQRKTKRVYELDKMVRGERDKIERIKIENSHEGIVQWELFNKVQSIIR